MEHNPHWWTQLIPRRSRPEASVKRPKWQKRLPVEMDPSLRGYEVYLYFWMFCFTAFARVLAIITHWYGLYIVADVLVGLVIVVSLFHLLVPPRRSDIRIVLLVGAVLLGVVLLDPNSYP